MPVTTQQIPTGVWEDDAVHSTVGFSVKHMVVATFRGRFEEYDATLTVGEDGESRLVGTVALDSLKVKDENLAAHLRAPDFFDAESHPQLRYESTSFRQNGEDVVVEGDLTIKGITHPVEARGNVGEPVEDPFGNTKLGLELEAVVDRNQFGLEWNAPLPKGGMALADEVQLIINLELTKAA
ncbi:MAG: YceI family protein [Solirubrobacteraceae bacterium]